MRSFGTTKLALFISVKLGIASSFVRKIIKLILDKLWKKAEVKIDEVAFEIDQKPIAREVVKEDKKVYEEIEKKYPEIKPPKKVISDEDRKKLIDQDVDFLNGGRRPK